MWTALLIGFDVGAGDEACQRQQDVLSSVWISADIGGEAYRGYEDGLLIVGGSATAQRSVVTACRRVPKEVGPAGLDDRSGHRSF